MALAAVWFFIAHGAPPPSIPGNDITGSYNTLTRISDTMVLAPPPTSSYSPRWLEKAEKTWDAPPLAQQIEEDSAMVPLGKGAIFIPRFSDPALEPTVQINEPGGKLYKWGETGKKYTALPGQYSVVLGSGSANQRIVKKVAVEEGKAAPLIPDWCGLTVDVVDESNVPFRGAYELARIDEFEAYGRSFGRDITRGERIKTWILKPGLYKIFTAGMSYNALTNFITVRLVPGEFVRVVIIENQKDIKIIGGGELEAGELSARRKSNWNRNLNIGGTITFNATDDRINSDNSTNATNIAFLLLYDLIYKKGSSDWETNIYWKEGLNFSDLMQSNINTGGDFRFTSLWVWRVFLPWLGPYFRTEFQMQLFPIFSSFNKNDKNHVFITLGADSSLQDIDTKNASKELKPFFSPVTVEAGVGTNIDAVTRDNYDAKLRLGLGYSQTNSWNQNISQDSINFSKIQPTDTALLRAVLQNNKSAIIQKSSDILSRSYGPEFGLALNIRAGAWGIARGDFRMRIPLDPLVKEHELRSDWDINATTSWTLTRSISLDYLFLYSLKQPIEVTERINTSSHSIFLRFSFNSR
jgi:hypothetical protein